MCQNADRKGVAGDADSSFRNFVRERADTTGATAVQALGGNLDEADSGEEAGLELDAGKFPLKRYLPLAELGRGGVGVIYLCRDRLLNKKVAIKTLRSLTNEALVAFQEEARATSKLKHPNIVTVMDFGVTEVGVPYLVMDYVKGISLEEKYNQDGRVTVSESVQIGMALCEALAYAHQHHIYHRDIKPSNVLLLENSTAADLGVKLIDFGIAKVRGELGTITTYNTRTIAGTPPYMSPDTVLGEEYDARSEIYSLGCLLFEAIEGHAPFVESEALAILLCHVEKPAPSIENLEAPQPLKDLIARMLEKSPDERPASMNEVLSALRLIHSTDHFDEGSEIPVPHTATGIAGKKWYRWAANSMVCLVLVSMAVLLLYRGSNQDSESRAPATRPQYRGDLLPLKTSIRGYIAGDGKVLNGAGKFLVNSDLKALKGNKNLQVVDLEGDYIDDAGIEYLTDCPLFQLNLRATNVSTLDWAPRFERLQLLNVARTDVDDSALLKLPETLLDLILEKTRVRTAVWAPRLRYLKRLEISDTDCDNAALANLKHMKLLTSLSMQRLANVGISGIQSLKDLRSLIFLDLTGIPGLDAAAIRKFAQEEMPYCDVRPYFYSSLKSQFRLADQIGHATPEKTKQTYVAFKAVLVECNKVKGFFSIKATCLLKLARTCRYLRKFDESAKYVSLARSLSADYGQEELLAKCTEIESSLLENKDPSQKARILELRRRAYSVFEKTFEADSKVLKNFREIYHITPAGRAADEANR